MSQQQDAGSRREPDASEFRRIYGARTYTGTNGENRLRVGSQAQQTRMSAPLISVAQTFLSVRTEDSC